MTRTKRTAVYISMPAWGTGYVPFLLDFCLPSMLAPGNIPSLAEKYDVKFVLTTSVADSLAIQQHPSISLLTKHADLILDCVPESETPTMNRCHDLAMQLAGDNPTLFPLADCVVSQDGLSRVMERYEEGYRAVQVAGFRVQQEGFYDLVATRKENGIIALSARELARMSLDHMHRSISWHNWCAEVATTWPSFTYFDVTPQTKVFRYFHLHLMLCQPDDPAKRVLNDALTFDARFVSQVISDASKIYTIADSDEFFMPSTSPAAFLHRPTINDNERPTVSTPNLRKTQAAQWAITAADTFEWKMFREQPAVVHGEDLPAGIDDVIAESGRIADETHQIALTLKAARRLASHATDPRTLQLTVDAVDRPTLLAGPADICRPFFDALPDDKKEHVEGYIDLTGNRSDAGRPVYSPAQIEQAKVDRIVLADIAKAPEWYTAIAVQQGFEPLIWIPDAYWSDDIGEEDGSAEVFPDLSDVVPNVRLSQDGVIEFVDGEGAAVRAFDLDQDKRFRVGFVHGNSGVSVNSGGTTDFDIMGHTAMRLDGQGNLVFLRDGRPIGGIRVTDTGLVFAAVPDAVQSDAYPVSNAKQTISSLRPVKFDAAEGADGRRVGFDLETLRQALPEAFDGKDGAVDLSAILPILTAALQDVIVEVDNLKPATEPAPLPKSFALRVKHRVRDSLVRPLERRFPGAVGKIRTLLANRKS